MGWCHMWHARRSKALLGLCFVCFCVKSSSASMIFHLVRPLYTAQHNQELSGGCVDWVNTQSRTQICHTGAFTRLDKQLKWTTACAHTVHTERFHISQQDNCAMNWIFATLQNMNMLLQTACMAFFELIICFLHFDK